MCAGGSSLRTGMVHVCGGLWLATRISDMGRAVAAWTASRTHLIHAKETVAHDAPVVGVAVVVKHPPKHVGCLTHALDLDGQYAVQLLEWESNAHILGTCAWTEAARSAVRIPSTRVDEGDCPADSVDYIRDVVQGRPRQHVHPSLQDGGNAHAQRTCRQLSSVRYVRFCEFDALPKSLPRHRRRCWGRKGPCSSLSPSLDASSPRSSTGWIRR